MLTEDPLLVVGTPYGTNVFVPLSQPELDTAKTQWPELKNAIDNGTVTINVSKNHAFLRGKLGLSYVYVAPRSVLPFVQTVATWRQSTS